MISFLSISILLYGVCCQMSAQRWGVRHYLPYYLTTPYIYRMQNYQGMNNLSAIGVSLVFPTSLMEQLSWAQRREACRHARLTYHLWGHMGTIFSHITSSKMNEIGLQNIHLCDKTDIWTEILVRNDFGRTSRVEGCVQMEFTVKKANGEGPAPLLAFTLTESENILDAFQKLKCLQA